MIVVDSSVWIGTLRNLDNAAVSRLREIVELDDEVILIGDLTLLEVSAVVFGIISVYLSTRENIWSWPTAIVNVSLYSLVFYEAKLYADMGLQVVYLVLSVYGWYVWRFGGEQGQLRLVSVE